jgi:AraC-like DNA-binding protein
MEEARTKVVRHESERGSWELVLREPDPRLRGFVQRYGGYTELGTPRPVLRQEVPSVDVPLILNFGAGWQVADSAGSEAPERRTSFVAGLFESSVYVAAEGAASCMQVDFTPIGAHLFLGVPMNELTNRVVDTEDVLGRDRNLVARLEATPRWGDRFALLDAVIASRIGAARRPPPEILWAWRALEQTKGAVRVGTLADRTGRSRRHLSARFREHVGLAPKTIARIIRFQRAVSLLQGGTGLSFVELAQECGYFDQPHLIRDFREFAATTPREFARRVMPDGGVLGA